MNDQSSDQLSFPQEPTVEAQATDATARESEFRDPYSSQNRREQQIIETRSEDLAAEQTGFKDVTPLRTAHREVVERPTLPARLSEKPRQGRNNSPNRGLGTLPQEQAEAQRGLSEAERLAQLDRNRKGAALARAALHSSRES